MLLFCRLALQQDRAILPSILAVGGDGVLAEGEGEGEIAPGAQGVVEGHRKIDRIPVEDLSLHADHIMNRYFLLPPQEPEQRSSPAAPAHHPGIAAATGNRTVAARIG